MRPLPATLGTTATILLLDQLSKAWVLRHTDVLAEQHPTVGLTIVWNEAVAFSLPLRGWWAFLSAAVVLLVLVPALARSMDRTRIGGAIVLGALVGGAVGNLIDRVRFGAVLDFMKVGWWPVFNVADAAISLSVVTLLLFGSRWFPGRARSEQGAGGRGRHAASAPHVSELGFDASIVPLVLAGTRTVTIRANQASRSLRPGQELDAVHTQEGRTFGRIRLESVERMPLGAVPLPMDGYHHQSTAELREELQRYYTDRMTDRTPVTVLRFELLAGGQRVASRC